MSDETTIRVEIPAKNAQALQRLLLSDDWREGLLPFASLQLDALYRQIGGCKDKDEMLRLQGHIRRVQIFLDLKNSILQDSEKKDEE